MARKNLVSATLSDADKQAAIAAVATAKSKLPFLVVLNPDQRANARKMGDKSVNYVRQCLRGAQTFPQQMKGDFDTPEFAKDVNLISQLWDVRVPLAALLEQIDDSIMAAGMDAMQSADEVYNVLKLSKKNNAAVKSIFDEIAQYYEAQSKPRGSKKNTEETKK